MRIARRPFTVRQDLRGIVLRMSVTNALSGIVPEVSYSTLAERVRGVTPTPSVGRNPNDPGQRTLDSVPSAPKGPLPRGSLLDLRV